MHANVLTMGLDWAKHIFQAHGADETGKVIFRRKLRQSELLSFFVFGENGTGTLPEAGSSRSATLS